MQRRNEATEKFLERQFKARNERKVVQNMTSLNLSKQGVQGWNTSTLVTEDTTKHLPQYCIDRPTSYKSAKRIPKNQTVLNPSARRKRTYDINIRKELTSGVHARLEELKEKWENEPCDSKFKSQVEKYRKRMQARLSDDKNLLELFKEQEKIDLTYSTQINTVQEYDPVFTPRRTSHRQPKKKEDKSFNSMRSDVAAALSS
eukprot:TRINITY_DN774298_c0_g1_i1.p1 TRINITY_DN774298_c0_g1~~TRINITY_DN774298_c0_g1_i1.p1  ORF type:complete len:202 (-),score=54.09 TRINITY_DN774298_c0_g1_i1:216-821(-)